PLFILNSPAAADLHPLSLHDALPILMSIKVTRVRVETPMMRRLDTPICTPPRLIVLWNHVGTSTARARGETNTSAAFCSSVLTANEVMSIAFIELERTGRNATRSVATLANPATTTAEMSRKMSGRKVPCSRYHVYPATMMSSP